MVNGPKQEEAPEPIKLYDDFICAETCVQTLATFNRMCQGLQVQYPTSYDSNAHATFYEQIKNKLPGHWQCKELWSKLDKKYYCKECFFSNRGFDYKKSGRVCENIKVLVIGGGPVGMRTAIEMAFLGAKVVVVEKRDKFSRNNILHLWPFLITDLKQLGAKKYYGRFCSGALDHIAIRQLQLILLKTALLMGVEVHVNTGFNYIREPTDDASGKRGWTASITPQSSIVNQFEFDMIVGADARRNSFAGFPKREMRGKLAIGLTCNFVNHRTNEEAQVAEISGVAYHFNQSFFEELSSKHGIDLENIVYYKGDTHYFVMCAKKPSLLRRGVLIQDLECTNDLVSPSNVNREQLKEYVRLAADIGTKGIMPQFKFAKNAYGKDDVALFDFTRMYRAENSSRFEEKKGYKLLLTLVGDSLIEPFWPLGTGCARGFLAGFDVCWMARQWCVKNKQRKMPLNSSNGDVAALDNAVELEVLAEREAVFVLLQHSEPAKMKIEYASYTIHPQSRYKFYRETYLPLCKVRHLYTSDREISYPEDGNGGQDTTTTTPSVAATTPSTTRPSAAPSAETTSTLGRKASLLTDNKLLTWCKTSIAQYRDYVTIYNMTSSWKNGMALCALIHAYRPHLIDMSQLDKLDSESNNQLAFDTAEKHLGIPSQKTGREMATEDKVDKLFMYSYISQFYELFKGETPKPRQRNGVHVNNGGGGGDEEDDATDEATANKDKSKSMINSFLSKFVPSRTKRRSSEDTDDSDQTQKKRRGSSIFPKKKSYDLQKAEKTKANHVEPKLKTITEPTTTNNQPKLTRHNSMRASTSSNMTTSSPPLKRVASCRKSNRISMLSEHLTKQWQGIVPGNHGLDSDNDKNKKASSRGGSETLNSNKCYFCKEKVYIMERLSAEGHFFHRKCFTCHYCGDNLRRQNYHYDHKSGRFFCKTHADMADKEAVEGRSSIEKKQTEPETKQQQVQGAPTPSAFAAIPEEECEPEEDMAELPEEVLMQRNNLSLSRHKLNDSMSMSDTSSDEDEMFDDDYAQLLNKQLQTSPHTPEDEYIAEKRGSLDDVSSSSDEDSDDDDESVFGTTSDENDQLSDCTTQKRNEPYSPLDSPPLDEHTVSLLNRFTHVLETDEAESEKDKLIPPLTPTTAPPPQNSRNQEKIPDLMTFDDDDDTDEKTLTSSSKQPTTTAMSSSSDKLVRAFASPDKRGGSGGESEMTPADSDDMSSSFKLNIHIKKCLEDRRARILVKHNNMSPQIFTPAPTSGGEPTSNRRSFHRSFSDTKLPTVDNPDDHTGHVKAYGGLFTDDTSIWTNLPDDSKDSTRNNSNVYQQEQEGTTTAASRNNSKILRNSNVRRTSSYNGNSRRKSYKSPLESVELRLKFRRNSKIYGETPRHEIEHKENNKKQEKQKEKRQQLSSPELSDSVDE